MDPAIEDAAKALAKVQEKARAKDLIGRTISHYRIVEEIGQRGMGEVFLADATSLHRKVALKFLRLDLQQDPAAHNRFLREARTDAALDSPPICSIHLFRPYAHERSRHRETLCAKPPLTCRQKSAK